MASGSRGLLGYILRRTLLMVPTLFGITVLVFALCQFVPGGPIDQFLMAASGAGGGGEGGGGASRSRGSVQFTEAELAALKGYYGFDKHPVVAYGEYVAKLARLDLGTSFRFTKPVSTVIAERLPISIYYGLAGFLLTYIVCIPLGILKAIRHRTWLDSWTSMVIFVGYAVPSFALGAILLTLFSVHYQWFPLGGFRSGTWDTMTGWQQAKDIVWHSVLPLISYMVGGFAFLTLLMKNSLMDNLAADFVRTALANGLPRRRAILGHAMRNSLIPMATSFGHNIGLILAGSAMVEKVFNIPGMGLLFLESMQARDYPVVMGLVVISSLLVLIGNLLSDMCVAAVDPRVRFE